MLVNLETQGDTCVVKLEGRFVTGYTKDYLNGKTEELKATGCRKVIADFSDTTYIDSTGIGFVIAMYTSVMKSESGKFVLANPNRRVKEVLDLTKLSSIIPIYSSVARARAAVDAP